MGCDRRWIDPRRAELVVRLWIDTDVGDDPDDAIALLCAAAHPDVVLVGVSTVDGDHRRRVRIARTLVDAPVHAGDDPALPELFRAAAPDALLAIGPLTNVAALAATGPFPPVTLMGGAFGPVRHWGFTLEVEHNFGRDPHAAAAVLDAVDAVVVPLNVTVSTCLDDEARERLVTAAPILEQPIEAFLALQRDLGIPVEDRAVCLHDPLAFLTLVEPDVVRGETRTVRVDPQGRLVDDPDGSPCQAVTEADAPRAIELVLGLVTRSMG
jgi:inosine-uridine nucleoside N-ribohydrolase